MSEAPKREDYPSRQAFRSAVRAYDKQDEKARSYAGRPSMQRLVELEKRVARMNQGVGLAFHKVDEEFAQIRKILEANGLTDTSLIIRAKPGDIPPRNPDA